MRTWGGGKDGLGRGRPALTRIAHGATDGVVALGEEELDEPGGDEASRAGHAHALPRRHARSSPGAEEVAGVAPRPGLARCGEVDSNPVCCAGFLVLLLGWSRILVGFIRSGLFIWWTRGREKADRIESHATCTGTRSTC